MFRLTLPAVGENLIRFSARIIDTFLMGHLGTTALAVLGLSSQLFVLGNVFVAPIMVGGGVLVAQAIGAADRQRAHRILGQAIWLSLAVGVGMMIVGLTLAGPALQAIGGDEAVVQSGTPFLRLFLLRLPFFALIFALNNCLRGAGDTRTPMVIAVIQAVVRVGSALVLVNGFAGFPELGSSGVAVGAILGEIVGAGVLLYLLARGRLVLDLKQVPIALDVSLSKVLLRLGIPSGGEQLALRLGQAANVRVIAGLGTVSYAAYLVGFNTLSVAFTVGIGFTVAATTIVAQQVGARNPLAARAGAIQTWIFGLITIGSLGLVMVVGAPVILSLFTSEGQVIELATFPLQLASLFLAAEATNQILSGAFRGAGDTVWPLLVTSGGNWLIRLPLTLVLIGRIGLVGAWLAIIIEISLRALINTWRFFRMDWGTAVDPVLKGATR